VPNSQPAKQRLPIIAARSRDRLLATIVAASLLGACSEQLDPSIQSEPTSIVPENPAPSQLLSTTDGVAIYPGQSIQAAVNGKPAGTKFTIKAGTHHRQTVVPKDGDKFVGEAGAILDGDKVAYYAFQTLTSAPRSVVIQGLIIQNYATANTSQAVIQGDNAIDWTLEANEIRYNTTTGIRAGDGMKLLRNKIHHNGLSGIVGYKADNVLVDGNEISYNNTSNAVYTPIQSTVAGMKFMIGQNLTVRNNNVHHNQCKGIWTDHMNLNTLIEANQVTANRDAGIWHEASYNAIIRNNVSQGNGAAGSGWLANSGIQVSNSPNVEIYGNTVTNNGNGIGVMYASGYPSSGPYGALIVQNLYVHDNTVTMSKGRTGLVTNTGDKSIYTSRNNRFVHNTYYLVSSTTTYYMWNEIARTPAQWRAVPEDATGSFHY
jgi:parallel beta-helix repeat protein